VRKYKIDETDVKILRTLLNEARTTLTELAKESKISVGAVRARLMQLQRLGIINGAIMQVNPHILGYRCICDLAIKTTLDREVEVIEFLRTKPYVRLIYGPYGRYNLNATTMLTDIEKLSHILEELEAHNYIEHVDASIWADTTNIDHPENLIIESFKTTKKQKKNSQTAAKTEIELDETDLKIAKILTNNARTPFRRIAKQLGVSTKKVIQRYRKLRGSLLTLSTVTIDLQKLGYKATAHFLIKVANKSSIPKIHLKLLQMPNIIVLVRLIGNFDLSAMAVLKDFEDMIRIREQIQKISGIEYTEQHLIKPFDRWPLNFFASTLDNNEHTCPVFHPKYVSHTQGDTTRLS